MFNYDSIKDKINLSDTQVLKVETQSDTHVFTTMNLALGTCNCCRDFLDIKDCIKWEVLEMGNGTPIVIYTSTEVPVANLNFENDMFVTEAVQYIRETEHSLVVAVVSPINTEVNQVPNHFRVMNASLENLADIHFQQGPIADTGANGVMMEDLLAIVAARLEGLQKGALPHANNQVALEHIQKAICALDARTQERVDTNKVGKPIA